MDLPLLGGFDILCLTRYLLELYLYDICKLLDVANEKITLLLDAVLRAA